MCAAITPSIDEMWKVVGTGASDELKKLEEGLTSERYMAIYTGIHDYCTSQRCSLTTARVGNMTFSSSYFVVGFVGLTLSSFLLSLSL